MIPLRTRASRFGSGALLLSMSGCMTELAVNTQAEIMEQASPVVEEQIDFEISKAAAPAMLLQIDGLLRVSPENERLLFLGLKGWASYAYGYLEDGVEAASARGAIDVADRERHRTRAVYLKAKDLGLRLLLARAPELGPALERDPDALKRVVDAEFSDRSDVPALFWTGYAWGSAINVSRDDPALLADLALPTVLVERAVELDENYYNAAGHVFLGVVGASRSKSAGGDPEKGRRHFERALALTGRKSFLAHFHYAQSYAVLTEDRALFVSLLNEVLGAEVVSGTEVSLANVIAQRRSKRLLSQVGTLFFEP